MIKEIKRQRMNLKADPGGLGWEVKKYMFSPCLNCKGQIRDLFGYHNVSGKSGIFYAGLVELIVNAVADMKGI